MNRLVEVADAVFGTELLKDCAPRDEYGAPVTGQSPGDCFFANGDPKEAADVQRDRITALPLLPTLDTFTLTHGNWLAGLWLAGLWLDEDETWNPLSRTDLEGVELVDLPESWRTPETARAAFRKTWCEREGLSMAVCDHPASQDRPEPATRQAAREAWCGTHKGVDPQACLDQLAGLEARFEAAWAEERAIALANLPRLSLAGRDLRNASAVQASLVYADVRGARLEGANLREARLEGANLREARLEGADLGGARLERADLGGARLEGADLGGARLEGANLREARLERAVLRGARLEGADLGGARLEGADLGGARLEGAVLFKARLEGANLFEARLEGANLWQARLEGANLWQARLEGANLRGARLEGAVLGRARLEGAVLRYADTSRPIC